VLGQDLEVGDAVLGDLFQVRATAYRFGNQNPRAIAMYRHARYLAERAKDNVGLARTLVNMSDALLELDPVQAVESAPRAVGIAAETGNIANATVAVWTVVQASILTGDWDRGEAEFKAGAELHPNMRAETDAMAALLYAMRGEVEAARDLIAMEPLRASE